MVGDFAGYKATGPPSGVSGNLFTYTFGPRLSYRKNEKATPFVHALFGGARLSTSFSSSLTGIGRSITISDNAFAMALGGGFDVKASPRVAIRLIQAEYALTRFSSTTQNNIRISAGIVFRLGGRQGLSSPQQDCGADLWPAPILFKPAPAPNARNPALQTLRART